MPTKSDLRFATRELRNGLELAFPPPDAWFDIITAGLDAIEAGSLTHAILLDEGLPSVLARNVFVLGVSGLHFQLAAVMRSSPKLGELRERFRVSAEEAAALLPHEPLKPTPFVGARRAMTREREGCTAVLSVGISLERQTLVETWTHPRLGDAGLRAMKTMLLSKDGAPRES